MLDEEKPHREDTRQGMHPAPKETVIERNGGSGGGGVHEREAARGQKQGAPCRSPFSVVPEGSVKGRTEQGHPSRVFGDYPVVLQIHRYNHVQQSRVSFRGTESFLGFAATTRATMRG